MPDNPYESPQTEPEKQPPRRRIIRLWSVSLLLFGLGAAGSVICILQTKQMQQVTDVGVALFVIFMFTAFAGVLLGLVAFIGWALRAVRKRP